MKTKMVRIDKDVYELTAVTSDIGGAVSIELISNVAPLVISLMEGDIDLLNKEIRESIDQDKLMRILIELINPMILKKNNELIRDWKEEFQCKPLTLMRLGYEALRFNCEDFFTFISGLLSEKIGGINLKETIESLKKEGAEIPPIFSLLIPNGEEKTQVENQEK